MADVKDILLKIGVVTDTDKVEALGKALNSVLGVYEDNAELLAQYKQELNDIETKIKALNKAQQQQNGLTDKQKTAYADLIKQEREKKQLISELQIVMKNQEKLMQSENGTMRQQSLILGQLRMLFRQLTDEQKAALPQLKTFIDGLDSSLKKADASIGNFQRNVGNYPQLLQQILPVQSQVGQGLMQLAQNAGASTGAIGALAVGLGAAVGAYKLFQQAQELTQTVGDAVAIKMAGWEAVWHKFIRTVVSADFSNFIQGLRDAKNIGEETAAVLDELFERNNALTIAEAKASVEQQRNLKIMRDQTRSVEERKAAGEAYTASVMELAQRRQDIAKQEHEALLKNFAAQTGASEEQISWYIENYDTYRVAVNQHLDDVAQAEEAYKAQQKYIRQLEGAATTQDYAEAQELYKKWQAAKEGVSNLSEEEQRFLAIQSKYNLANDEMTTQLVNSWASVYRAIAGAEQSTQRASTTVSSITAQQQKEAERQKQEQKRKEEQAERERLQKERAKVNASTQIIEQFGAETDALIDEFLGTKFDQYSERVNEEMAQMVTNALDDLAAMEQELDNSLSQAATTLKPIEQSPLAKALGVSDEQLTSIKSQALQAAQQIYGSIQQIAQQASQRRLDNELKAVETEAEREKAILKAKLDSGALKEDQYAKKIAEIDKKTEARREEMQKEAFEREKRWNIASALMNAAMAITQVFRSTPPPASFIMAGITAATTAAQIATIASQKYARGGELHGASHAQGGIKGNIQGHNIELEGDEVVINKRSSRKYRSLLSYINSDNGWGVDFAGVRGSGGYRPQLKYARGGVLGSYDFSPASVPQASILQKQMERQVEQTESLIAATNRRIDRLQVQVNISDIEGASNTKRVHINRAKL